MIEGRSRHSSHDGTNKNASVLWRRSKLLLQMSKKTRAATSASIDEAPRSRYCCFFPSVQCTRGQLHPNKRLTVAQTVGICCRLVYPPCFKSPPRVQGTDNRLRPLAPQQAVDRMR